MLGGRVACEEEMREWRVLSGRNAEVVGRVGSVRGRVAMLSGCVCVFSLGRL